MAAVLKLFPVLYCSIAYMSYLLIAAANGVVDPSGSYFSWKASAMGKNVSNAKTFLEKRYTDDMELDDAVHTAILTLKEGVLTPAEIEDYLQEVE
uniref:Uncharacterized protein n=1 Tax=Lactuca sativa TaxID=4236 RepID=A0A9R1XQR2_LACSA|nr:hypothetical protein LSAT_V11C300114750 [Lactuca sativa]